MTSAQKDAPISPSLQCVCAMRQLLPLLSCHEAARQPAGPKLKNCRWCYSRSRGLLQELLPTIDIYDTALS